MEVTRGVRGAVCSLCRSSRRAMRPRESQFRSSRHIITTERYESTTSSTISAAPEINFDDGVSKKSPSSIILKRLRIVPASASYFSGKPTFTDDFLHLQAILRKYQTLPIVESGHAPRVAWKTLSQYNVGAQEPIRASKFHAILKLLQRLNYIHPALMPEEVTEAMQKFKRDVNPFANLPKPRTVDQYGKGFGLGRRKTSTARAWLIEGDGQVLINGKTLPQMFGRLHDRESAIWALKATNRIDKYNLWALVEGGGVTGQAEALTLAVGKALMVHEPLLKPALRRGMCHSRFYLLNLSELSGSRRGQHAEIIFPHSNTDNTDMHISFSYTFPPFRQHSKANIILLVAGCVTRDPRKVERKKPGHLKARKMPTWVKR